VKVGAWRLHYGKGARRGMGILQGFAPVNIASAFGDILLVNAGAWQ